MSDFDARGVDVTGGLTRETNWWGAFVIGLAGTVLVIGLIGYSLLYLGGFAIVLYAVLTAVGVFLCFCLAEMAAHWPERSGGLPSYAFESFKPVGPRVANHVGGLSSWGYWLGWFTVAPINAYLAAVYFNDLFSIDYGGSFGPIHEKFGAAIGVDTFVTALVFLFVMFVPCWLGIRLGATFATILGIGTMFPLILLIILPVFDPGAFSWSNLDGFGLPEGVDGSFQYIVGWAFIYTWTVLAMEAAACYIGECREPARDAKIALTAEGIFGFIVYLLLPLMVLGVLGYSGITGLGTEDAPYLGDASQLFQGYVDAIFGTSEFWEWFIGLTLIIALLLSVLNAVMGASRGLYQNSHDGILPKAFGWSNSHHAPSFAMLFSLFFSIGVLCLGSPLQIYVFSNMGYLFAVAVSLIGYGIFRATRNDEPRPLVMPVWMGPLGLILGIGLLLLWAIGGYFAADYAVGTGYRWLYWIGLILLALYFPLYWFRRLEDRAGGGSTPAQATDSGGSS
jgi:amino acid transporter